MNYHNPQNFGTEEIDAPSGWRFLTVEEAAILTDKESSKTPVGVDLFERLNPQIYLMSGCRWVRVITRKGVALAEGATYRTQYPEPQEVPTNETAKSLVVNQCNSMLSAAAGDFVESLAFLSRYHHEIMIGKGFWKMRNLIVKACQQYELENDCGNLSQAAFAAVDCQSLALVGTEVSEMVEGIRHGNQPDDKIPAFSAAEAEAADVFLRLMDLCEGRGWRLGLAVIAKIEMNKTRASMHGGKEF